MPLRLKGVRLNRKDSMRGQVYALLRKLILTAEYKPGELIDEKSIASDLGISRTPVREAVKQLSDEHLIDIVAQSATRASQLDLKFLEEAYLIRRALEMESAAQASQRMSQTHIDALDETINRHMLCIEKRQFSNAITIDDKFHSYIAGISNLDHLWQTVELSKAQLDRCRHIILPFAKQGEKTIQQHRAILKALRSADSEKARTAMQKHLDYAYNTAITKLKICELDFPQAPKRGGRSKLVNTRRKGSRQKG